MLTNFTGGVYIMTIFVWFLPSFALFGHFSDMIRKCSGSIVFHIEFLGWIYII